MKGKEKAEEASMLEIEACGSGIEPFEQLLNSF